MIFFVTLLVLTCLLMLIGVGREALRQGLSIGGVLQLIPYAIPNALAISLPGTMLFSVCSVYGRMSSSNEIMALQSVGVSPFVIMRPALLLGLVLSVITVGLVNIAFTWGHHGIQNVVFRSVEQVAYKVLERDRRFQQGTLSITVLGVAEKRLLHPTITVGQGTGPPIVIEAREAKLASSASGDALILTLTDGNAVLGNRASFAFPGIFQHSFSLQTDGPTGLLHENPSHMQMSDLSPATIEQNRDVHRQEGAIAACTGFSLLTSQLEKIADQDAQSRLQALNNSRRRISRLETEKVRRWASGFTCLALTMVGIPLAILLKTSDLMTTFGICFLPTLLVYYPVFAMTLDMAKSGTLPPASVWIANYVFMSTGIALMRKALRA